MSSAQLKSKINFSQTGQGILEVIVTIAIGTIMILALVILSVRSNRASDFSKANSQASSLATQGLEIIRNIRSSGGTVNYNPCGGALVLPSTWSNLYTVSDNLEDDTASICNQTYGMIANIPVSSPGILYINNNTDTTTSDFQVSFGGRTFTRAVYIADTPTTALPVGASNCNQSATDYQTLKQFTVVVSWTDSSGTHQSVQSACLAA